MPTQLARFRFKVRFNVPTMYLYRCVFSQMEIPMVDKHKIGDAGSIVKVIVSH